jgi:hypothetical protein
MFKKLLIALILSVAMAAGAGKALATPQIDPGGIGDLNLFGLYDVRMVDNRTAGWQNFIVIENTSNQWTAVHLRFRGWKKSIEVYDHVILLSPFDVFWCVLENAQEAGVTTDTTPLNYTPGDVKIWSTDYETLYNSGLTYEAEADFTWWLTVFQPDLLDDCGYIGTLGDLTTLEKAEMQAGEVEIIGLWQLTNPNAPLDDTHDLANVVGEVYPDGAINIYDVMNALYYQYSELTPNFTRTSNPGWQSKNPAQIFINAIEYGPVVADDGRDPYKVRYGLDCGNVLASAMSMGDITNARYQLSNFVAISDFRTDQTDATRHRDLYAGGAIVYPVETLFWSWDQVLDNGNVAYYVNANWATTVGAVATDGDDLIGIPQVTGGAANAYAMDPQSPNNTWSLDDLETALANDQIWYQYYNNAWGSKYTTDVAIAFFTKHLHFFFADWPYWNVAANFPGDTAPAYTVAFPSQTQYYRAVYDYRGIRGAAKIGGTAERSVEDAGATVTIKQWYMSEYKNGPISAYPYVWDMDQNKPVTTPDYTPPPGSPWHPVPPPSGRFIPHEVNIIRVGAPTPVSPIGGAITDATGFLTNPAPDNYDMGQFSLLGIALTNGQRELGPVYGAGAPYLAPSIGVVMFDLQYGEGVYRSCMAPWHFRLATPLVAAGN